MVVVVELVVLVGFLSRSWRCRSGEQVGSKRGISSASGVRVGLHARQEKWGL